MCEYRCCNAHVTAGGLKKGKEGARVLWCSAKQALSLATFSASRQPQKRSIIAVAGGPASTLAFHPPVSQPCE